MFRTRLRELRERAGYGSQQSFADAFGVAQSTVGGWEAGKREPNYSTTLRLAKFFGVSIDYLLGGAEQKDSPAPEGERVVRDEEIRAAFFGGADDDLTEEEMDAMWHDAKDYIQYKLEQRRRLKHG